MATRLGGSHEDYRRLSLRGDHLRGGDRRRHVHAFKHFRSSLPPRIEGYLYVSQMARPTILTHTVALLAVCFGASCSTPTTSQGTVSASEPEIVVSGTKEPPLPLVKWDDLPIGLKKASIPPYSAISYCASRASSQGSDSAAVKAVLDECLSADLLATQGTFLSCHFSASGLEGKAYVEQRRKCLLQSGAKPG